MLRLDVMLPWLFPCLFNSFGLFFHDMDRQGFFCFVLFCRCVSFVAFFAVALSKVLPLLRLHFVVD